MEEISSTKRRSPAILSIEKYLDKEEKSVDKHEFYNGKTRKTPGSSYNHNKIAANIIIALGQTFDINQLSFEVISSDQKVFIPKLYPSVIS